MELLDFIVPFLWSGLISLYAVPSVVDLAWEKGLMDSIEQRKIHHRLTPRLGGVAIFAGTYSGILIFAEVDSFIQYFLAAILILFFLGVKDDLQEINTWKKLVIQILAAFLLAYYGEFTVSSFYGFLGLTDMGIVTRFLITVVYIIAITNAINFIDGLDGLAASVGSMASLALAAFLMPVAPSFAIVGICLGASLLGFLRFNLKESAVFMGDSGSLITGFIIAILSLKLIEVKLDSTGFVLAYSILFIPITDFARVILVRLVQMKSPFSPGRDHIHHIFIDSGFSRKTTLLILIILNLVMAGFGITLVEAMNLSANKAIFVLILFSIFISVYIEHRRRTYQS